MSTPPKENEDFVLSLNDLWNILKKKKNQIGLFSLAMAVLCFFYSATKPITYQTEGSFKDKGKSSSGMNSSLSAMLLGGGASESSNSGLTILKSAVLAEKLVKKNGLQINIIEDKFRFPFPSLGLIKDNLQVEYALLTNRKTPVFMDPPTQISAHDVDYKGEIPVNLILKIDSKTHFTLLDQNKNLVGQGIFNEPFISEIVSMTLKNPLETIQPNNKYILSLTPLHTTIKGVSSNFKIKLDPIDKMLINITYNDPDRHKAVKIVNDLMDLYMKYIKNESKYLSDEQIAYLAQRRKEIALEVKEDMEAYATTLSSDISSIGFPSSSKAMDFLANSQAKLKSQISANKLELKRLEKINTNNINDYEKLALIPHSESVKELVYEMEKLKQQTDSLNLALQKTSLPSDHSSTPFEVQGINLETAQLFYIDYSNQLQKTELEIIQQNFLIKQFDDPNFEISSSSQILKDPVSIEMIIKTGRLALSLKDTENLNFKEQTRLKSELAIQKSFLIKHLQENISLLELHASFLKQKITNLQSTTLALIDERASILENQIKRYIVNTIDNLKGEQTLLNQNISDNRIDMGSFPEKWTGEQLIQQKIKASQHMVMEITRLVETKNINANLEKSLAAPFELPHPSLHPNSPRLLLFTFLGAIAGLFFSAAWFITRSITQGIEASVDNLKLSGQHVSGSFSRDLTTSSDPQTMRDNDLNTMRRLISFMIDDGNKKEEKTLLLLENQGPNYANRLADLIAKKNLKVLLIDLCFDSLNSNEKMGLIQYLQKETTTINILHSPTYDLISSGGVCRYGNELLGSHRFQELLSSLSQQYDWVIAYSNASIQSAEATNLTNLFPNVAVSLMGESINQLSPYMQQANTPNGKCTFIVIGA